MRRWEARWPECTWVSMKPGQTSLSRASISSSTVPEKAEPMWTTRSPSQTTTPSRMSVCPPPAKPTTQPPRISPRIRLGELRVARGLGGALAFEEHAKILRACRDEAGEQEVLQRGSHIEGHAGPRGRPLEQPPPRGGQRRRPRVHPGRGGGGAQRGAATRGRAGSGGRRAAGAG